MAVKICAQIWVPTGGWTFTIQRTDIASPLQTITVPAGAYYLSEDGGASDLCETIEALVRASHADQAAFWCYLYTDGRCRMHYNVVGQAGTLTWGAAASLRDLLRYSGATTLVQFVPVYGARCCAYLMMPGRLLAECRWIFAENRPQSIADSGDVETHHYGSRPRLLVGMQWPGGPYSAAWGDYHAIRALWQDALAIGRICRIYRDTAVLTAYAEQSNPLGYSQGVCVEPVDFEPLPVVAGWYDAWQADFVFQCTTL